MARPKRLHLLTGRPSRYTIEAASEILTRLSEGESLHKICRDEHLPADATVRDWADNGRHRGFGEAYRRARRHQAYRWFEQCVEIADETINATAAHEVFAAQTRVRARQWACAKMAPDEFGDRLDHRHSGAVGVQVVVPSNGRLAGEAGPVIDGEAVELVEDDSAGEAEGHKPER